MKIAILDDYQSVAKDMADWDSLQESEVEFFSDHLSNEEQIADRLHKFDIVMGMRERTPFPKTLIEKLPNLKLLITSGARNASFDLDAATKQGVIVCGTPGQGEGPTELTWGLILALLRNIPQEDTQTRKGQWGTSLGIGLEGKTLGILGLGHIGSLVARVGIAFGMNIIAWSTNLTADRASECNAKLVDKAALFEESDIVSIHVRLSDRTHGLVGQKELELMKATAYLINISRGPIVDEASLVQALESNAIAGAGLDTFDIEPLPTGHPLLKLNNTILTPHIGYVTKEGYSAFYEGVVENIRGFLSGEPIRVINKEVL
ncbi:MAG: D-2-hydroxyacid dehydrogenase family protein [Chloroflexota bacterium]|nr:D-2-hydroxyacid dehydrogenase family protein [Chloroflexota bacterium]